MRLLRSSAHVLSALILACVVDLWAQQARDPDQARDDAARLEPEPLFPVKIHEKWGYIDKTGRVVIAPQFDYADDFSEGLALVNVGGEYLWGNEAEGGKWGYLAPSGQVVIKPQFDLAERFHDGRAWVCIGTDGTGTAGFIDKTGEFVFADKGAVKFDERYFTEGLLPADVNAECAFVDTDGKVAFFCSRFLMADTFSEGLAKVTLSRLLRDTYGFIDKNGDVVIKPRFDEAGRFSEGLAPALIGRRNQGGKYGYIDKKGRWAIRPRFQYADQFSEGLAMIWGGKDEKCGFIDKTGEIVIEQRFDEAMGFSDGLAAVEVDEKWGFIDKVGHVVVEPRYDDVQDFSHGLAQVRVGGKIGYIDKTGNYVWEPTE